MALTFQIGEGFTVQLLWVDPNLMVHNQQLFWFFDLFILESFHSTFSLESISTTTTAEEQINEIKIHVWTLHLSTDLCNITVVLLKSYTLLRHHWDSLTLSHFKLKCIQYLLKATTKKNLFRKITMPF